MDTAAALTELAEIAKGRGDLLAEAAGLILGFRDRDEGYGLWPRRALEAALLIAAGADLSRLSEQVIEAGRRAELAL